MSGRKTQEKTEFRTMILDAAWSLVLKDGWPALSLRNISESIHYSVPVIYDHFENKEAILLEFSRQGFGLLRKKLFTAGHKCRDPREQLQAIAIAYWTFAFRNPAYYQLMFGLGMPSSDMEKCREERNALRNLVVAPIQSILKAHGKNEVIAGVKYHTYWSVLHGLVAMKMLGCKGSSKTPDKLIVVDAISGFVRNLEQ